MNDLWWDAEDEKYGRKVGYVQPNGARSTAYLDSHLGGGLYAGVNKHTGEPVKLQWNKREYNYYEVTA